MYHRTLALLRGIKSYLTSSMLRPEPRLWLSLNLIKGYSLDFLLTISGMLGKSPFSLYSFERQEKLIQQAKYDALIILDACRYDMFSEIVHEYLDGELRCVVSPASVTIEWLKRVWSGNAWRDTVYVSASPMINKRGLLRGFDARDMFLYVEEVWDWGWSESMSTVPPDKVNLAVKVAMTKLKLRNLIYPRDYRLIVHYVQPHAPYIKLRNIVGIISTDKSLKDEISDMALRRLGRFTGKLSIDYTLLGLLRQKVRGRGLRRIITEAYKENLRWVLEHIARLVTCLNGRIIITSDHGELLGEYGLYFHPDLPLPYLRLVPWFAVK